MRKLLQRGAIALALLAPIAVNAQLNTNPDKFFGNITTRGQVNGGGVEFASLWDQLTAENESKWVSVEGTRNSFNWSGSDRCYNYCRQHNIPFKFHCLVWGSQYPNWMNNLTPSVQYNEIIQWMDAIQARYPDLDMIDVVNEAIPGHAPAPYKDALGGDGVTGYDWIIKAFELAHERWPDAILIYNDYNTFQWQKTEFINLVKILRDAGAPIDAYGCQSHDLTDIGFSTFKQSMTDIQDALKMPMYSTEYDIGTSDDQKQLRQYRDQIKYMWEQDYVAGVTLWGYIYGSTWTTDGNSGLIRNGVDRPAMTWLREYMATEDAKAAKSPYPGKKKEASLYIRPEWPYAKLYEDFDVNIDARLATKTIDHIDFYIDGELAQTFTDEPYVYTMRPEQLGHHDFKADLYATDGAIYTRYGGLKVMGERKPYGDVALSIPGVIEAENFDSGGDGLTFHDSDNVDEGNTGYRTDNGGLDIGQGNGGYVVGYTANGEWMDYTVDIEQTGRYQFEATVSSGIDGSAFTISTIRNGVTTQITDNVTVPSNGDWNSYKTVSGTFTKRLNKGEQILRVNITGSYLNLDRIVISKYAAIDDIESAEPGIYEVFTTTGIHKGQIEITDPDSVSAELYSKFGIRGIYLLRNVESGSTLKVSV